VNQTPIAIAKKKRKKRRKAITIVGWGFFFFFLLLLRGNSQVRVIENKKFKELLGFDSFIFKEI